MTPLTAVVLAGGEGTRLRPLTLGRPKPILPVANRPFLFYQLDAFVRAGIERTILTLSYKPERVRDVVGERFGEMAVDYTIEEEPMGTGGAVGHAAGRTSGALLVTNGDVLCDLPVERMHRLHVERGDDVTLLLVHVDDPSRYGVVDMDERDIIRSFVEKPAPGSAPSSWINAGVYLLSEEVAANLPSKRPLSIEKEVFPLLIEKGLQVGGLRYGGYWKDVGTIESYVAAHTDFIQDAWLSPDAGRFGKIDRVSGTFIEEGARVASSAHLDHAIILKDVNVGEESRISHAIVGDGVSIGAHTILTRCVLGPGSTITPYSRFGGHP